VPGGYRGGRLGAERLTLQDSHDLWQARQRLDLSALSPMELKVVGSPWSFRTPCLRA
jgi:hypothetical protein